MTMSDSLTTHRTNDHASDHASDHVNDRAANASDRDRQPAVIAFGLSKGKMTDTILTNAAGTKFFCGHKDCTYEADNYGSVFGHRSYHGKQNKGTSRIDQITNLLSDLRTELADTAEGMVPAEWKPRALDAERRLATLRRALS